MFKQIIVVIATKLIPKKYRFVFVNPLLCATQDYLARSRKEVAEVLKKI